MTSDPAKLLRKALSLVTRATPPHGSPAAIRCARRKRLARNFMYYETERNDDGLPYNPLKACVVPRPIGWLTTINTAGIVNLAPFSFFNLLSYDPPFVMFSSGVHEDDAGKKDTVRNVEETGEFVYTMSTWAQHEQMNQTAALTARGLDEMAAAGLEPLPSRLVRSPRVKGSPVHFECRLHQILTLPGRKPSSEHHVVIGQVIAVYIDDAVLTPDGRVDVLEIRPIARLGYRDYRSVDAVFQMEKRMP